MHESPHPTGSSYLGGFIHILMLDEWNRQILQENKASLNLLTGKFVEYFNEREIYEKGIIIKKFTIFRRLLFIFMIKGFKFEDNNFFLNFGSK